MTDAVDLLDCLERTVNEIEALEAIYGSNEVDSESDDQGCCFSIISKVELDRARSLVVVEQAELATTTDSNPVLELEIRRQIQCSGSKKETHDLTLRCRLPPGYPELPAKVAISVAGLTRSKREQIALILQGKADSIVGQEAVMDLVDAFKELVVESFSNEEQHDDNVEISIDRKLKPRNSAMFGRRWIWVHHIQNSDRRKSIIAEALGLSLGGFLKFGYPGVMVVEGDTSDCDEFVSWVKGNKSRPGGFGRNWGHHVRGHIDFADMEDRKFTDTFEELEDMGDLGRECKDRGAEEEFLKYILQHRGSD